MEKVEKTFDFSRIFNIFYILIHICLVITFAISLFEFQNKLNSLKAELDDKCNEYPHRSYTHNMSFNRVRRSLKDMKATDLSILRKKLEKCKKKKRKVRQELGRKKTGGLHLISEYSELSHRDLSLLERGKICKKNFGGCLVNRVEFKTNPSISSPNADIALRMWKKDIEWGKVASLETGQITIRKSGIYQVYAQLTYLDRTKSWSFHIDRIRHTRFSSEDGRSLTKCLFRDLRPDSKSKNEQSCYTSVIMKLKTNDTLVLKNYYANRSIAVHSFLSFWGVIRLSGTE